MSHNFSQIPRADIQRSSFDRSHGLKTTFDSGYLVPIFVDEVLPGDTFNLGASLFARLATPAVPIMDNVFLETFWFFVPNRLVWNNWQKFNGEQENPGDSTDYLLPTLQAAPSSGFSNESLGDYFGLPTGIGGLSGVNALPFRAYNLIYNEWFRDENLQDSLEVPKGDGPDPLNIYHLKRRGKRHDYFTSCLPWPQKGPGVELPLGTCAPVYGVEPSSSYSGALWQYQNPAYGDNLFALVASSDGTSNYRNVNARVMSGSFDTGGHDLTLASKSQIKSYGGTAPLFADLTEATAATINTLRQAFQLQRLYERDARGGTRYTEIIRSHFGVISPDARLQRPEFLGGSSTRINVNPVVQTSSTDATTPQGNLAAFGVGGDNFHGFTKSFTEHGYIIGLVNVRCDLNYQQGLDRMWSRQTRFDFYWPSLAHLGEQAVLNKEIYAQGNEADDGVFGYQERYAEYRYKPSKITGKFRSTDSQSLDVWHLAQKFDNLPTLSADFIEDKPPLERVVAVTDEPQFIMDCYFKLNCVRPMPVYSVPGLIDHF